MASIDEAWPRDAVLTLYRWSWSEGASDDRESLQVGWSERDQPDKSDETGYVSLWQSAEYQSSNTWQEVNIKFSPYTSIVIRRYKISSLEELPKELRSRDGACKWVENLIKNLISSGLPF